MHRKRAKNLLARVFSIFVAGLCSSLPGTLRAADQPAAAPTQGAAQASEGDIEGLKAEIVEVRRTSGGTVTVKFTLTNGSSKEFAFHAEFGEGQQAFDSVSGIHLIDPTNKKKYFVVRDENGDCVCSRKMPNLERGAKASLYAKFPAPPDDVKKITIEIPHFPPFEDVSIAS